MKKQQLEKLFLQHQALIKKAVAKQNVNIRGITAEDVQQEVSIKLLKLLQDDRQIDNLSSYIYKITANVVIDLARKQQRHQQETTMPNSADEDSYRPELMSEQVQPDRLLSNQELQHKILQAINALPESRRIAVKMRLQGYSVKEMCEMTGWPFYKAENLSKRSMQALKEQLKKMDIDYEID